ncbi:hypothetical protein D3C78_1247960 [compost metagenome]
MRHYIIHKAEQSYDRDIGITFIKHCVCIASNSNPELYAQFRPISDIHPYNSRIDINRTYDFRSVFI